MEHYKKFSIVLLFEITNYDSKKLYRKSNQLSYRAKISYLHNIVSEGLFFSFSFSKVFLTLVH